ncbi:hypothetical protein [Streptomyces sp. ISID311]|uniref:alpha/beta hydrolase n=1 Tax=Streptomyces sp. ISID311 TaxID=2601673 RepID=UPI001C9BB793|nr:hypothetical protein [Streptomyces sp. ISID311]
MLGHSLGGATAAAAIRADRRLRAGVNLEGSLLPPVTVGTDRPFLLFGSDPGPGPEDPSWDQFWTSQYGWKRELALIGSTHTSFTDLETLLPQAAPALGLTSSQVKQAIGTVDPHPPSTPNATTYEHSSTFIYATSTTTCSSTPHPATRRSGSSDEAPAIPAPLSPLQTYGDPEPESTTPRAARTRHRGRRPGTQASGRGGLR